MGCAFVASCKAVGSVKHLLVIETDLTFNGGRGADVETVQKYLSILNDSGISYTYVRPITKELENMVDYTYIKGLQKEMKVKSITTNDENGINTMVSANAGDNKMYREDLAAFCVQSLLSLDWNDSRILCVSSDTDIPPPPTDKKSRPKTDKEWCVNSNIYESKLTSL